MNNFTETKKYPMNDEVLYVTVGFSAKNILNINFSKKENEFNDFNKGSPDFSSADNVDDKIKSELQILWKMIDSYFFDKNFDHEAFFQHILDESEIYNVKFTPFQQKVYRELCKTKKGEFLSYKELGDRVGSRAYRAVGTTMKRNRFPPLIPCHRCVGSHGIGGFGGVSTKPSSYKGKNKNSAYIFNLKNIKSNSNDGKIPDAIRLKRDLLNFEKGK